MAGDKTEERFLLRIEATNLGNFVYDTDDLSTIRGAGLLLLNSSRFLCGLPDQLNQPGQPEQEDSTGKERGETEERTKDKRTPLFSKGEGGELSLEDQGEGLEFKELKLLSWGASVCLFQFKAKEEAANDLRDRVDQWLREDERLQHATYAVAVAMDKGGFLQSLERSLMRARVIQMRGPNVSIGAIQTEDKCESPFGFCDIDQKRVRAKDLKKQPKGVEGSSYAKAGDKNHASQATHERRAYGRKTKVSVYQMIGNDSDIRDFRPSWELEEIAQRGSACDDRDKSDDTRYNAAKDKMAVIYIDGNKFGSLFRKKGDNSTAYCKADREMRNRRRKLMLSLVRRIKDKPHWQVKVDDPSSDKPIQKTRIETLLWGGDELIWVVPAWCAVEAVRFFFTATSCSNWKVDNERQLTHAVGMVLCSYKAPIRSVVTLARDLAESVKDRLEDLRKGNSDSPIQYEPTSNAMAYEVLESFDHLGPHFDEARAKRRMPQMREYDAILTAEGVCMLHSHLRQLKTSGFPKRRIHQIAQVFRRTPYAIKGLPGDSKAEKALNDTAYGKLIQRIADTLGGKADIHKERLNDLLHWECLSKLPAKWFHLMELWDYAGYSKPETPTSSSDEATAGGAKS